MAADPTGQMMASLLSLLVSKEDAANRRILTEMGYQLGRYVYFTDALDDLKKDAKKGAFNPFLLQRPDFCWETDGKEVQQAALQTINRCIGGAIDAYALLELHHLRPILDNIFYFGLQQTAKRLVLNRKQESKEMEIN
jgi:hypothetical protein